MAESNPMIIGYNPYDFTVSGDFPGSGKGILYTAITELLQSDYSDSIIIVENMNPDGMAAINAELALQNSGLVDPSTVVNFHPLTVTNVLNGSITVSGDSITYQLELTDMVGNVVFSAEGTCKNDGSGSFFDLLESVPRDLAQQIQNGKQSKHMYERIVNWLKTKYGDEFPPGSSTEDVENQLEDILQNVVEPYFKDHPERLRGWNNFIAQRQYGDLVEK